MRDSPAATKLLPADDSLEARVAGWLAEGPERALAACTALLCRHDLTPLERAIGHIGRTQALVRQGAAHDAVSDAERAVGLAPTFALSFEARAVARFHVGELDDACADLDVAHSLDPGRAGILASRALVHLHCGRLAAAAVDIERALRINPDECEAYLVLARLRCRRDDLEGALAALDRVLELDPNHVAGYHQRADLHRRIGDHERAYADYVAAIARAGDAEAWEDRLAAAGYYRGHFPGRLDSALQEALRLWIDAGHPDRP